MPAVPVFELYDLVVEVDGEPADRSVNAVRVLPSFRSDFDFVQVTDTHLTTHGFYSNGQADADSTEMEDFREVIRDINLLNPEFVLLTGDLINEGELEDFNDYRYFSRSQGILTEFTVPVFLVSGNHDIGGWDDTPPSDGTARRNWWRFFGWPRLDSPPPGAPSYTQDYSFDYGAVHFTGIEAYNNYDRWRLSIYDYDSFIPSQLSWLAGDLAAASGSAARVLFYHSDFQDQLDLPALNVDLALAGHVHRDGQNGREYTTDNVCDGARSFRLVHYANGGFDVPSSLSAGSSGQTLTVSYTPANDGTADQMSARAVNGHDEGVAHALLRFVMPAELNDFAVGNGTLVGRDVRGDVQICLVEFDLPANSTRTVTIAGEVTGVGDAPRTPVLALRASPNPFNPSVSLDFALAADGPARVAVYDLRGQEVAVLADGPLPEGDHRLRWDGRDRRGEAMPSGVYFARIVSGGRAATVKLLLAR